MQRIENLQIKDLKSFQLDTYKSDKDLLDVCSGIVEHCSSNKNTSIIVFSSPETLLLKKPCIQFISDAIDSEILRLFCIDEVHLFVQFGLSFRRQFQELRQVIINYFRVPNTEIYKVPLLFMTATFNNMLMGLLEQMLGIYIDKKYLLG